jgi:hypothetical protein
LFYKSFLICSPYYLFVCHLHFLWCLLRSQLSCLCNISLGHCSCNFTNFTVLSLISRVWIVAGFLDSFLLVCFIASHNKSV